MKKIRVTGDLPAYYCSTYEELMEYLARCAGARLMISYFFAPCRTEKVVFVEVCNGGYLRDTYGLGPALINEEEIRNSYAPPPALPACENPTEQYKFI